MDRSKFYMGSRATEPRQTGSSYGKYCMYTQTKLETRTLESHHHSDYSTLPIKLDRFNIFILQYIDTFKILQLSLHLKIFLKSPTSTPV